MMNTEYPEKKKKFYTPAQAFEKICSFCAYQERSHKEVRNKLYEYGLYQSDVEELISRVITEGFLNEERFAIAFAGGKFRIKKWGRKKIINELEAHGVSTKCIKKALAAIEDEDYDSTLTALITKKFESSPETDLFKKKDKVARFAIGKGYESERVWQILKKMG